MKPISPAPKLILCNEGSGQVSRFEIAQLLRMTYPGNLIYFIGKNRDGFDRQLLVQNGCNDAFLFPFDLEPIRSTLGAALSGFTQGDYRSFHPVKLMDVKPGTVLRFDLHIYLAVNDRYVLFAGKDEPIDVERTQRLADHLMGTVFVETSQLPQFYAYAEKNKPVVVTSMKEAMQDKVRTFIAQMLNSDEFEKGERQEKLVRNLTAIVEEYVLSAKQSDWYLPLLNWVGERHGTYNHVANLALYGSLFATRLEMKNVRELVLAALMHDLGLANLNPDHLQKDERDWTAEERIHYQRHPITSSRFITVRGLTVPPLVRKIIEQHHERYDGSGYPAHLKREQILPEAQLLGLIDFLDYHIAVKPGQARIHPHTVIAQIDAGALAPGQFSPDLVRSLRSLLPSRTSEEKPHV